MKKKTHWRLIVLRWHRRIGLILSLFLVWMLSSGVLLNHTDDLALNKQFITNTTLLNWYGIAQPPSFNIAHKKLQVTNDGVWLEQQNLGSCARLLGLALLNNMSLVVCSERILLLSDQAELIDQLDQMRGLQPDLMAMAQHNQRVFLKDKQQAIYEINSDDLSLSVSNNPPSSLLWLTPTLASSQINLERVLLDAHSGRLLGAWGKYFVDAFAFILMVLLVSGWWLAKKRHKI